MSHWGMIMVPPAQSTSPHRRAVGPRVRHTVSRPDTKAGWQEGTPKNPTEPKKYLLFGQCWEEAKTVGSRPGRTFADRAGAGVQSLT